MYVRSSRVFKERALLVLVGMLTGCSAQSVPAAATPAPERSATPTASAASSSQPEPASSAASSETLPRSNFTMPDVNFVPAKVSEAPKKMPKPWIETPGFDQFVAREWIPNYKVMLTVPNLDQMPPGSYVQFLFDGRPLEPVKEFKGGLKLVDLVGQDALADGEHIIAAYVARPNHESVKGAGGVSIHRFWIGKKAPDTYKSSEPIFALGRPFGQYKGDAAYDILIDWFLLNAVLDKKEYSVHMVLKGPGLSDEGVERYVTEWRPWTIVSAKPGEYTLKADLLDPHGKVAKGTWTSVTRTFSIAAP